MRRPWLIHLVVVICCAASSPARAQWQLSVDASTSRLQQAGLPEATASNLGATLDVAGEFAAFRTSTLGSYAGTDRWTGQWLGAGSVLTPAWNGVRFTASAAASAFGQSNARPITSIDVVGQAQIGDARHALALGGGTGATAYAGTAGRFDRAIADGWWVFAADRVSAEASITRTPAVFGTATLEEFGGSEVLWNGSSSTTTKAEARNYLDVAASWLHDGRAWTASVALGARRRGGVSGIGTWEQADATLWVAPRIGITLSGGRTLDDLVRGVPHARFLAAGLRITTALHPTLFRRRGVAGPRIAVARSADGHQRIEVRAAGSRVDIMGDFTRWVPVALDRVGDHWRLDVDVPAGPHRVAIRVDDGPWIVPANLPRASDDFGGVVGIITIP